MADIDFGKQVGPLPLGAWVAVIAGGLGIALYSRNSGTVEAPVSVVEDTGGTAGVGTGDVGGWTVTQPPTATPDPGTSAPTTNDEWGNKAINYLIAQNYEPSWSYSAITKALAGGTGDNMLSVREYALWNVALRALGAPPYPVSIPPPSPLPQPQPPPPSVPDTPAPWQPPAPPPNTGGSTNPNTGNRHAFVRGGNGKCAYRYPGGVRCNGEKNWERHDVRQVATSYLGAGGR